MKSESYIVDLDTSDAKSQSRSIPQLVSYLRSAFRPIDFDTVERILVSRESKYRSQMEEAEARNKKVVKDLMEELDKHKVEFQVILEKNGDLALQKCLLEDEVKRLKVECEGIVSLKDEVRVLEREKEASEAELEAFKKRFKELGTRVARLEEETESLKEKAPENTHFTDIFHVNEEKKSAPNDFEVKYNKEMGPLVVGSCQYASGCVIEITESDSDDEMPLIDRTDGPSVGILSREGPTSHGFENAPSLDEVNVKSGPKEDFPSSHKRKRNSCINVSKNDEEDTPTSKHKPKSFLELIHESKECPSLRCPVSSPSLGGVNVTKSAGHSTQNQFSLRSYLEKEKAEPKSSNHLSEFVNSSGDQHNNYSGIKQSMSGFQSNRVNRKWDSEVEMLLAFNKYPEICMEAVCALYRQNILVEQSVLDQGFSKFEAHRGSSLAKFLVDGDPHGKLKKSVTELQKYDSEGLHRCKRLATWYSEQLFDIYSKKKDPLFLPF